MSVTPWNQIPADQSPFVTLFLHAGIGGAALIMNLVVLSSVMSSMNSGVFSTSRMLFGLAKDGQAPQVLAKLSSRSVPAQGLFFSCLFILAGAALQYFVPNTIEAFTLASSLCVILFISIWSIIMVCYIRYRKHSPELHEKSTFKMPGGLFMSYVVLIFLLFTLVILSLEPDTLKALIISPLWVIIMAVTYRVLYIPRMRKRGQKL